MLLFLALGLALDSAKVGISPAVKQVVQGGLDRIDPARISALDALSNSGDASATELLGEIYLGGLGGLAADRKRACTYFERASLLRPDSAHNYANCHYHKQIVGWDATKARIFYQRGIDGGWPSSRCALGIMLVEGTGGERDIKTGISLCRQAAESGDADAQTDLGNYLLEGKVVAKNIVEARKWYALAATQKQANAALVLGQIYWNGDGTPVDHEAAARWWKVAYAAGRKDAAGLLVRALFRRVIGERGGKSVIVDRSLLPELAIWLQHAATDEPDPVKRKLFADSLASLTTAH